ncbi:U3 snoRNP protein [Microsporum canis]|uniref:U3 snoRNP protein Utp20 n=1 Tax=Arthroderma otae (strain ATCC MYA-4605 / CBS 113480) TaxID=554155 RepID=C5G0Z3_ARTOC|nr:U3 snoRNP protein Utp20 [Microsporum canis CBS 113480]EEQ35796.1 U3 snoRNP protein Utp20 [Microsporum canis CBS 113480]
MVTASSSHRSKPPRLLKGGTATTKSHRWEPFSQRVLKLKIDPVHRVRRTSFGEDDADETSSCFRASLEHWMELNLSENFTEFVGRVNRLCESLPQILYHQDAIMGLLVEYIEKKDELSMEPLLSLMAQFARDLGPRFEKHFATAVQLVASVAATHQSIDVIEWSFTCLAWIFKFLSRLLVPDLRPLLAIMTQYLGKEHQKHFVSRFAAESVSFLIRKTAAVYYKDKKPLERAVTFLFQDLANMSAEGRQVSSYQEGLMTMFADATKGIKGAVHSNGIDILRCLMKSVCVKDKKQSSLSESVLSGVLINIVHYCTADTFRSVLYAVCEFNESTSAKENTVVARVGCHALFLCIVTRKGSRVADWNRVHTVLLPLLAKAAEKSNGFPAESIKELLGSVAFAIQASPMDELLPHMRQIMDAVTHQRLSKYFIPFCDLIAGLDAERFQSVVHPYFQKFIVSLWEEYEQGLCVVLPRLQSSGAITSNLSRPGSLSCPNAWKMVICKRLNFSTPSKEEISLLNAYSKLPEAIGFSSEPSIIPDITRSLHQKIWRTLESGSPNDFETLFTLGQGLLTYVRFSNGLDQLDQKLWPLLCSKASQYSRIPVFLEAISTYASVLREPPEISDADLDQFANALLANLASPSHKLRLLSLEIFQLIFSWLNIEDPCLSLARSIETSELTLQAARVISMDVRRLGVNYAQTSHKRWLDRLIPSFCFGLLWKKLASVWDDACEAMKVICETDIGESIVSEIAMNWLQEAPVDVTPEQLSHNGLQKSSSATSEYECYNVNNIQTAMHNSFCINEDASLSLLEDFESSHSILPLLSNNARSQALRVLNAVPKIAEKRSRLIVPLFLSWASRDDSSLPLPEDMSPPENDAIFSELQNWSMQDKKAMLTLFGKFTNPKVLYQASEAHDAVSGLLCNGDLEIQKLALKALFTWKSPAIRPYEQNLLNLVDDSRFKDELGIFVHVGKDNSLIKSDHIEGLFPYLLKLLYGKMVARAGSRGSLGRQEGRRKAILRVVSQLPDDQFSQFVQISFGSLGGINLLNENGATNENILNRELMSLRKQLGLLNVVETMFSILKRNMLPFVNETMNVVLYCLIRAYRQLAQGEAVTSDDSVQLTLLRNIRQLGVKCLDLVFSISPAVDWKSFIPLILSEVVNPRLDNFSVETAQAVSGLLHLFRTWATSPKSAVYFEGTDIIPRVVDCLGTESARDEVKIFVLDEVLISLVNVSTDTKVDGEGDVDISAPPPDIIHSRVLGPHIEYILMQVEEFLRKQPPRYILGPAVEFLSRLSALVESSTESSKLISTTTFLLQQPPDRVPPKTKGRLLKVLHHFLPLFQQENDPDLTQRIFEILSSLFDYFKDGPNRVSLASVFDIFVANDLELAEVGRLIADLNSMSTKRLDEVDFERRLKAFSLINEEKYSTFTAKQWRPLLFNMIYHLKDEEELAIRSSASFGVKRFIQISKAQEDIPGTEYRDMVEKVLLPALRSGVKQNAETVRAEFVSLLGYLVQEHVDLQAVSDMQGLLAGGDEEASFFNNILHIQQHRRQRALKRLTAEVSKGKIQATNVSTILFPLIEHFVFQQSEDENAHNLTAGAINTVGSLSEAITWNQFKAIFRRYQGYVKSKSGLEKSVIRLLSQMTDALSHAVRVKVTRGVTEEVSEKVAENIALDDDQIVQSTLSTSIPRGAKLTTELKTNLIPFLTGFTNKRSESDVALRLPVAVAAVKLLKLLPENEMALMLPPLLLDVSNILRSRAQDTRDIARKTLADIAIILGPSYFGYILAELKGALSRGYQLHVLSFTVHSILVATADKFEVGALDQDLSTLGEIIMDDIFGTVGQQKDAEEYVSKMKEVKSSKSYDSAELLAKNASIRHIYDLVRPVQLLLQEKLTTSLVGKIDELLRRIGIGLLRNPGAESRDLLMFCYEVMKESYKVPEPVVLDNDEWKTRSRFLIQVASIQKKSGGSTTSYLYKLARFSLDALRSVLNKYSSLLTVDNVAGFVPIIGDSIVQGYEEVKLSAIRLLSTIIKLPLPELDKNADVYIVECVKLMKESASSNTDASQAALKLVSTVLRERKRTTIKDSYLAYLLQRVSADIDEPDRQGIVFNFIRAVMSRKFMVPEIYEVVDKISVMMVTNHTRNARDLARGTYVQFLLEYPQSKSRWNKQLAYLAKNLDYAHREGRESVMEAIHLILSKTNGEPAQEMVDTFFIPMVMVMSNDEAASCREMAGSLLGIIFARADAEHLKTILAPLKSWLEQSENVALVTTGLQAIRIFFESDAKNKDRYVRFVTDILPGIMGLSLDNREANEWEVLYYSLQLFMKLSKLFPDITLISSCTNIWLSVLESLCYPQAWIRSCAANLVGVWLADIAKTNASTGYASIPLVSSLGLVLDGKLMLRITRSSIFCLKTPSISEDLATQTVRNLIFLGRCFGQNNLELPKKEGDNDGESEDEEEGTTSSPKRGSETKTAIQYIFEQAARIIRKEALTTRAESLNAKVACMKMIAALCSHLDAPTVIPYLQTIFLPLLHLTDPSIPAPRSSDEAFQSTYMSLVTSSQEILDLLQKKLGTTDFVAQMSEARERVKERREGRRVKRRIEAVTAPEKFGRDKKRKHDRKREKRKERGLENRNRRHEL